MTAFTAGWLMGLLTGGLAGVMGLLTYQWMAERARWRARTELDPYVERLRALDRSTWVDITDEVRPLRRIP